MKKRKKNKLIILQKIKLRAGEKKKLKKRNKRKQVVLPVKIPRTPRKFLRKQGNYGFYNYSIKSGKYTHQKEYYTQIYLPTNLKYIVTAQNSPLNINIIKNEKYNSNGNIDIPENLSIIDYPKESYLMLKKLISALLIENTQSVFLNYKNCKTVELGTQVLLDIILMDFIKFRNICHKIDRNRYQYFPTTIGGLEINQESIQKMIFSVGSPVNLRVQEKEFPDIVRYKLCKHDNENQKDEQKRIEQKVLDTTELADYVIDCLKRINKKLTSEKRDDLCTVIGETLINAEEHSTTKHRFSIGYFKEEHINGNHFGIFQLVIMNFGQTIYEKFKSADCPNQDIVRKMKDLSKRYTKNNWFKEKFEEENLWTLYALQEGVTSVSTDKYKRGNGSIRFIESFFKIKGSEDADNISKMIILSGKTQISFDGRHNIIQKTKPNGEIFKVMTFNQSGNIEEKPDNDYVFCNDNYFPGTMICAKILLNDDDLKQINNL